MNIEKTHKKNFKRIKESGIKKGDILINKKTLSKIKIESIHPLYGWVVSIPSELNQNLDNISDYEIVNKNL